MNTEQIIELFKQELENQPQVRTKTKFLWLPKTIQGKIKWLCTATWEEKFMEEIDQEALDLGTTDCLIWVWKPTKWIEK